MFFVHQKSHRNKWHHSNKPSIVSMRGSFKRMVVERWTLNANWSLWIINPALNFFSSLTFTMRRQEPKRTMVLCRTKNKLVYGKYSVFLCKHVSACVGPHKTKMTFTIHNATIKTCDLKGVMTLLRIVSYLYDIFSLSEWSITLASNRPHDGWF